MSAARSEDSATRAAPSICGRSAGPAATAVTRRRRNGSDAGSSDALGLALVAPAMIGLALVVLHLGRAVDSRATVQVAAETGAQAAAQERTAADAAASGRAAALAMLVDETTCRAPEVRVDTTDFRPGGVVAVTASCTPSNDGLDPIGPPPERARTATALATIDPLRTVGP